MNDLLDNGMHFLIVQNVARMGMKKEEVMFQLAFKLVS